MNKFLTLQEETRERTPFNETPDLSVGESGGSARTRWFSAGLTARRYSGLGEEGRIVRTAQPTDSAASLFRVEQAACCEPVRGSDREARGLYAPDVEPL